ncbi:MAG: dephospho-CoA kinase [Ignavibacteriae bacterium]|nr:dephospho-CoA kinase [Ignavibacteriota bacterium]
MKIEQEKHTLLVIGLTGNIGSGKSEVAKMFEQLGAKLLSADTIAKELMVSDKSVREKLQAKFGTDTYFSDGTLNRSYLAKNVFTNEKQLKLLNSIIHPVVIEKIEDEIVAEVHNKQATVLVVEAALIIEAGIAAMFDYIVVVVSDEDECIKRVVKRDGVSQEEALNRMKSQMAATKKAAQAAFVIQNTGTLTELKKNVSFVFSLLSQMK